MTSMTFSAEALRVRLMLMCFSSETFLLIHAQPFELRLALMCSSATNS